MNYEDAGSLMIWNMRLDFDPVGIKYIFDESELSKLEPGYRPKARITFCQYLAASRQAGYSLLMTPDKCGCGNAQPVFGFRELNREKEIKQHMKYFGDPELSWQAPQVKARFETGKLKGVFVGPLSVFDQAGIEPSLVYFMCVPYQAYHILNDYMAAMKKTDLDFHHTPNSAVCSGGVHAFIKQTANMTTMCAGSKTSGKTEMNFLNLFIPGSQFLETAERQKKRCEESGGPSLLGSGGQPWPGLDACKGCPLFVFEKVDK